MKNNPLTFIVNPDFQALTQFQEELPREWEVVSIGKDLSKFLIAQEFTDYSQIIHKWLDNYLREKTTDPIICFNVDILFYPTFNLDPLALFRQISRHKRLIVLWTGEYKDGVLSYAQPEHHHYRFWKNLKDIEIKGVYDAL